MKLPNFCFFLVTWRIGIESTPVRSPLDKDEQHHISDQTRQKQSSRDKFKEELVGTTEITSIVPIKIKTSKKKDGHPGKIHSPVHANTKHHVKISKNDGDFHL